MATQRKQYRAACKARVALEAFKGVETIHELASAYGVHPTKLTPWTHRLHKEMPEIFSARRDKREHDPAALHAQRYQQIGPRKVALDWGKKLELSPEAKRESIEPDHPQISIARPCALLEWPRSSFDYVAKGERAEHLPLLRLLDEQ